ncbi:MAG TPA: metallophosphatase [Comamonadaceae bacterium]|uniref:metallophosphoesterase n=1 Tax=Pulveribacter sp. TaxID=2678893 RepID=UPI000ED86D91|nr:metallophosphoesterase [Pulveribacter sp.]HCL86930.1 metallophosphatase [Comamonadaceae bacterium]
MLLFSTAVIPLLSLWLWWPASALPWPVRLAAVIATALLASSPALLLYLMQAGRLGYTTVAHLQVPSGWALATLVLALPLVLLRDVAWLAAHLGGAAGAARLLHGAVLTPAILALAAAVCAYGVWAAVRPPQVHEQPVALPALPPALDGLRVAVLADLHASPVNDAGYVQAVVQRTLAARPDLIVLPGDMVDGPVSATAPSVAPLAQLQAPLGVWLAPGNHEYYSGYDAWMAEFARLGLSVLQNRTTLLQVGDARLALSGIGDPVYGRTSHNNANPAVPEGVPPDVVAVAAQARAGNADFHLLLAHQPKFARDYAQHGIGLQVAGHTHGGHIRGFDRWVVAPFNNGFVRGLYEVGAMRLFVSNGAGLWSGFAVRLGVPARIDVLTLRRAGAPQ